MIADAMRDIIDPRTRREGAMSAPLLSVDNLAHIVSRRAGRVRVVDRVSLLDRCRRDAGAGGGVGMWQVDDRARRNAAGAEARRASSPGCASPFNGRELLALPVPEMRPVRGRQIGMIFQEPMTSLNPVTTVGGQVMEAIELHAVYRRAEARGRVIELFTLVGIPDPEAPVPRLPAPAVRRPQAARHDCHGDGNAAAAIDRRRADHRARRHDRAQILELLRDLRAKTGTAVLLITHDFGVVNEVADRVAIMYAGQIVEEGTRLELLDTPRHPYTQGLLRSIPRPEARGPGSRKSRARCRAPGHWPVGLPLSHALPTCVRSMLPTTEPIRTRVSPTHGAWCHLV